VFLERLKNHAKHEDVLFEMRPLKCIVSNAVPEYEIAGLGQGNTTCDWHFRIGPIHIVLDVKNRIKSLIGHMAAIASSLNAGVVSITPPAPNPSDLFRDVEGKFRPICQLRQIQGAWIQTGIKEDEKALLTYFAQSLNKRKVHFAIISDWQDDALILARNPLTKLILRRTFKIAESKRFVSNEYVTSGSS